MNNSTRGYFSSVLEESEDRRVLELLDANGKSVARVSYSSGAEDVMEIETYGSIPIQLVHDLLQRSSRLLPTPRRGITNTHDFILLTRQEYKLMERTFPHGDPRIVSMRHELMAHIARSLSWVPTWLVRETEGEAYKGLDLYGMGEVRQDGAAKLERLMTSWAGIFREAPEPILLDGGPAIKWSDDGSEEGTWYREDAVPTNITLDRDETILALEGVANLAKQLQHSDQEHFILYGGI